MQVRRRSCGRKGGIEEPRKKNTIGNLIYLGGGRVFAVIFEIKFGGRGRESL